MFDQTDDRKPSFNVMEPNPLLGKRTLIVMNPEMTRSICDLIDGLAEQNALSEDQKHLYAFSKRIRAHHFEMRQMFEQRDSGEKFSKKPDPVAAT